MKLNSFSKENLPIKLKRKNNNNKFRKMFSKKK